MAALRRPDERRRANDGAQGLGVWRREEPGEAGAMYLGQELDRESSKPVARWEHDCVPPDRPAETIEVFDLQPDADTHHVFADEPGERVGALGAALAARHDDSRAIPLALARPTGAPVVRVPIKAAGSDELRERELAAEGANDGADQRRMDGQRRSTVDRQAFRAGDEIAK